MTASEHLGRQFAEPGDDDAKKALLKQLKGHFPKEARAWIKDDRVTVDAPAKINPDDIDFSDYQDWRAAHQLKAVVKIAKGKGKKPDPAVLAHRPSGRLDPLDGHHHALADIDQKKKPTAFVVHVPSEHGPWDSMHLKQKNDQYKDDFGKTSKYDRND
jgi:hypothetical protein